MKKNRYTEEQIACALKQAELGTAVPESCRKLGIAEQIFYNWRRLHCDIIRGGILTRFSVSECTHPRLYQQYQHFP